MGMAHLKINFEKGLLVLKVDLSYTENAIKSKHVQFK
jgi:hypothetical protein